MSIEVEPGLAHDAAGTIAQAKQLWTKVGKPNAMIKIPATVEGLEAITATIARGDQRQRDPDLQPRPSSGRDRRIPEPGLEKAQEAAGIDISTIESVASFFVSRVDTEINARLEAIGGTDEALALKSKAGIANAQLAYQLFEQQFATERAQTLLAAGGTKQRPLWASTGVKDPALPDTLYVTELAVGGVVNTMPEKTLEATPSTTLPCGDAVTGAYADAQSILDQLAAVEVDYDDVTALLEKEGVEKFIVSWGELLDIYGDGGIGGGQVTIEVRPTGAAEAVARWVPQLVADGVASGITTFEPPCGGPDARSPSRRSASAGWRPSGCPAPSSSPSWLFATSCIAAGVTHIVLAGMGGSSLAPEVITPTYGVALTVLEARPIPVGCRPPSTIGSPPRRS